MPKATFSAEKSKWIISLGTISYIAQGSLFYIEIQELFLSLGIECYATQGPRQFFSA